MPRPIPSPAAAVLAGAVLGAVLDAAPAAAHPHVFIDVKSEIVFDADGRLAGVRHAWRFDEGYSAFASQGLDEDGDGKLSVEELALLAEVNVDSMADYAYFTYVTAGGRELDLAKPTEYWLQADDGGLLTLYFTVPLASPAEIRSLPAVVEVTDPTYYVAFQFVEDAGVALEKAPAGCAFEVSHPEELDAATAEMLATVGPEQRELPPEMQILTVGQTNQVTISCP